MAEDFEWLSEMHKIASRYGDGLKPELAAVLLARTHDNGRVSPPPVRLKSSGPAVQNASADDLAAANILTLAGRVRVPVQHPRLAVPDPLPDGKDAHKK